MDAVSAERPRRKTKAAATLPVRTNVHAFDGDDGNRATGRKHGLTEAEIEHALTHGARIAPDAAHSDTVPHFIAIGRAPSGRPIFVAFCWRVGKVRPISARYMHTRGVKRYETTFGSDPDNG